MARTVEHAGKRGGRDRLRIVAALDQPRQPLLAQAIELRLVECRAQRDVGQDGQRVREPRDGNVQAHGRRVDSARGVEIGAEEVDGVGDVERRLAAGAVRQHRRREARRAELAGWVVCSAREHDEIHLRDRDLVHLDDPDRQSVGQLQLLDRRQMQRRRRADRRRLGPIGFLLRDRKTRKNRQQKTRNQECFRCVVEGHCFFSGSTVSSTRLSTGRYCAAAALTSAGFSAL